MQWISVIDKSIPEDIGVLVCYETGYDGKRGVTLLELRDGWPCGHGFEGYEWEWDFRMQDITHWMQLPEPPHE